MCPACLTSMALAAAGGTTAGGLVLLVVRKLHWRRRRDPLRPTTVHPEKRS